MLRNSCGLSFITQLTRHLRVKSSGGGGGDDDGDTGDEGDAGGDGDAQQFSDFFPSFVWVLRDFHLELVDGSGDAITPDQARETNRRALTVGITAAGSRIDEDSSSTDCRSKTFATDDTAMVILLMDQYLERSLAAQPGFERGALERNRVRAMIGAFFPRRACVPLVRPVADETELQRAGATDLACVRPEFAAGIGAWRACLPTPVQCGFVLGGSGASAHAAAADTVA